MLLDPPAPPSQRAPGVPRDLDAICLRALEKDRMRRYPSALAFADDLARFLAGEATSAVREPAVGLGRPRPDVRLAAGLLVLAAIAAAAGGVVVHRRADEDRRARERANHDAEAARVSSALAHDRLLLVETLVGAAGGTLAHVLEPGPRAEQLEQAAFDLSRSAKDLEPGERIRAALATLDAASLLGGRAAQDLLARAEELAPRGERAGDGLRALVGLGRLGAPTEALGRGWLDATPPTEADARATLALLDGLARGGEDAEPLGSRCLALLADLALARGDGGAGPALGRARAAGAKAAADLEAIAAVPVDAAAPPLLGELLAAAARGEAGKVRRLARLLARLGAPGVLEHEELVPGATRAAVEAAVEPAAALSPYRVQTLAPESEAMRRVREHGERVYVRLQELGYHGLDEAGAAGRAPPERDGSVDDPTDEGTLDEAVAHLGEDALATLDLGLSPTTLVNAGADLVMPLHGEVVRVFCSRWAPSTCAPLDELSWPDDRQRLRAALTVSRLGDHWDLGGLRGPAAVARLGELLSRDAADERTRRVVEGLRAKDPRGWACAVHGALAFEVLHELERDEGVRGRPDDASRLELALRGARELAALAPLGGPLVLQVRMHWRRAALPPGLGEPLAYLDALRLLRICDAAPEDVYDLCDVAFVAADEVRRCRGLPDVHGISTGLYRRAVALSHRSAVRFGRRARGDSLLGERESGSRPAVDAANARGLKRAREWLTARASSIQWSQRMRDLLRQHAKLDPLDGRVTEGFELTPDDVAALERGEDPRPAASPSPR